MKELTHENFDTTIAKGNAIIDFWAPWCGPCRMMGPVFEETAKSHTDIVFAKINTDEETTVPGKLGIRGIPTLIFFKDGQEVGRHVGYADKRTLEAKIATVFR